MSAKKKIAAIGIAGTAAIGGGGLYAGSLSTIATGSLGAGDVAVQASCASSVDIKPGQATFKPSSKKFKFTSVKVQYVPTALSCLGQKVTINLFNNSTGSVLSANATQYTITSEDVSASKFNVPLDDEVDASIDESVVHYGIVIQSP